MQYHIFKVANNGGLYYATTEAEGNSEVHALTQYMNVCFDRIYDGDRLIVLPNDPNWQNSNQIMANTNGRVTHIFKIVNGSPVSVCLRERR